VIAYILLLQVNLTGHPAVVVGVITTAVLYLAGAWIAWRVAPVVAEAIIASPRIARESIDAHLIRIFTRLLGIAGAAALLSIGADRMGIPVYGIVAGLGVGGLAIALAAQPTVENLIGGLSLFADKSVRVGDYCRCGTDEGTVEAIGIRSTWIRGTDRTLTTIPNSILSKMPVVNFGRRDETMIQTIVGVRYETSPEQLRHLLVKIRELLISHPMIRTDSARARLTGFGASSLDIEVFAYVETRQRIEFLAVREDILLRIMELVNESGTGFAFPSQTLYFGRDTGLDVPRTQAAEAAVKQWREAGKLPFPNFPPEYVEQLQDTLPYPSAASAEQSSGSKPPGANSPGTDRNASKS
jgi:MscS family membrane protein